MLNAPNATFKVITPAPIPAIVFNCSELKLLNIPVILLNPSATMLVTGANVSPILIALFLTSFKDCFNLFPVVLLTFSNAVSVAPALFCISLNVLLKACPASVANTKAAFPASELLHNSLIASPELFASCSIIAIASPSDVPLSINSAKDFPVFSFNILATVLPLSDNSFNILFI